MTCEAQNNTGAVNLQVYKHRQCPFIHTCHTYTPSCSYSYTSSLTAVRIASHSGLDRSGTTTSECPSATHLTFSFSFCHLLLPLASTFFLPLDSTTGTRQTENKSLSIPLSQPPTFPFSLHLFFSFLVL